MAKIIDTIIIVNVVIFFVFIVLFFTNKYIHLKKDFYVETILRDEINFIRKSGEIKKKRIFNLRCKITNIYPTSKIYTYYKIKEVIKKNNNYIVGYNKIYYDNENDKKIKKGDKIGIKIKIKTKEYKYEGVILNDYN